MANHCFCGHSQMMPWCDGSHERLGRAQRQTAEAAEDSPPFEKTDDTDGKAAAEPGRKGWFARLFGRATR
ncbi:MAG: Iron-binding zinc finger type [Pseudomonadota bacterium]|jgi:CDGSH-type Zn-finger protein